MARSRTASDQLVERLVEWGPSLDSRGTASTAVESLRTHEDQIRFVHVRHEETAALAACAYGKFTGRPAACLSTAAPGAIHLMNGLYDARIDQAPVVAITGMTYHDVVGTHYLQDINHDRALNDPCAFSQPHDEDAKRLARQTRTLGEFLAREAKDWEMPRLERRALVHLHCHQRATSDTDCDRAVLERLGLDYEVLETGCCGMAGSFGYEAGERYRVSVAVGEQKLLPAVRDTSPHTLIITDGFSCASQIEQLTDRAALHLAQVVQMALHDGPNGPGASRPETPCSDLPEPEANGRTTKAAVAARSLAAVGSASILAGRRR